MEIWKIVNACGGNGFFAFLFRGGEPTPTQYHAPTLEEVRAKLPPGLLRMRADPAEQLVESWA